MFPMMSMQSSFGMGIGTGFGFSASFGIGQSNLGGLTGMGMSTGMSPFGSDSLSFSPEAMGMMGSGSSFINPLMYGGFGTSQMGMSSGMGMVPGMMGMGMNGMSGMQGQQQQMMMMMMMMMEMMMLMQQMMSSQNGYNSSGMSGLGGMPIGMSMPGMSGTSGMSGLGGYGYPIGMSGTNGTSSTSGTSGTSGSSAADLARSFIGQDSYTLKGKLSHFTAAGGYTNNCADFVSSCLESTGGLNGHYVNVSGLEAALKKQGYVQIPASQAQPGDVWISNSRGHTELVSAAGGTKCIGSNNIRQGFQRISESNMSTSSGVYYSKRG